VRTIANIGLFSSNMKLAARTDAHAGKRAA
jgi:hypothetical protein